MSFSCVTMWNFKGMTPKTSSSACKICFDASDGFHFGTLACRACAAFFRRSTVANRKYVCRYNDKCKIEKAARCMCRACRLKKCLALGMKPEHVQDQRGRIRTSDSSDAKESMEEEQKPATSVEAKPQNNTVGVITSLCSARLLSPPASAAPQDVVLPDSAITPLPDNIPVLKRIFTDYKNYLKLRKVATDVNNSYRFASNTQVLRELTLEDAKKMIRADVSVVSVFINECIPDFKSLPENEKMSLFKTFLKNFLIIDGAFWTAKYFPQADDDRCVIPFSGYLTIDALSSLFVCQNTDDPEGTVETAKPIFEKYRRTIKDSMVELKITEVEMVALLCISLWDNGIDPLCSATKKSAQETRNTIFRELYNYCVMVDRQNAPARYGTLLDYLKFVEVIMHETQKKGIVFKILDMAVGEPSQGCSKADTAP